MNLTDHGNIASGHRDRYQFLPIPYHKASMNLGNEIIRHVLAHVANYSAHEQSLHKPFLNVTTSKIHQTRGLEVINKCVYQQSAMMLIRYFNECSISASGPPGASRRSIQIISVYFATVTVLIVANINVTMM